MLYVYYANLITEDAVQISLAKVYKSQNSFHDVGKSDGTMAAFIKKTIHRILLDL